MHRTRLHMLANAGAINCAVEPDAPEGGGKETPPEGASNETPDETEGDGAEEEDEDGNDFDTLPDWARSEIKKLRKGEAKYRTANKELQDALKAAKSQDDIDAAVKAHQERNAELEVELAIKTHTVGFTPEQLALVEGKTPEEIEEKANKVRAAFTAQTNDPGTPNNPHADGGLRPGGRSTDGLTPSERAAELRKRAGRRRL